MLRLSVQSSLIMLLGLILLNGCSSLGPADGPPRHLPNIDNISDPIPHNEPRSKYGNSREYKVFGKSYRVLATSAGYQEQGIASWYGTKFNGQRTSNGERYDMLKMTAAHRTLPLPCYVKVTNLTNGRSITVRVNDRGPFRSNRIIDLSYVAAMKLGMTKQGTALVELTAITPGAAAPSSHYQLKSVKKPTAASAITASIKTKTNYHTHPKIYIQAGAFRSIAAANTAKANLRTLSKYPIQVMCDEQTKKGLCRVQIGPLENVDASDRLYKLLKKRGYENPWTVIQ